jgi:hypothetical protein
MKNFAGVPSVLSVLILVASGCSNSSSTPPEDAGGSVDSSAGGNDGSAGGDGGSCPVTPATGSVPAYTAPALAQGVCAASDVSAFVTACGSAGSTAKCATYGATASACTSCLFSSGSTLAPIETLSVGGQAVPVQSVGACIVGQKGSAGIACATAVDSLSACLILACAACPASEATSCSMQGGTAYGSVCATYASAATTCGTVVSAALACETSSDATLTAEANAICGSGAASDGGTGDSGASDSGADDAGTSDSGASDASGD